MNPIRHLLLPASLLLTACGAGSGLDLEYSDPPVDVGDDSARFAAEVSYGEYERNVVDILHFPEGEPTALLLYVHGGGFTGGDKSAAWETLGDGVPTLVDNRVAIATLNYRLLEAVDSEGVIKCLDDSKRGLQYLRHHAADLNIDPDRIVMAGVSAGAGTSLWMAFHDDMADPSSDDPVLTESTRIRGAVVWETQATYDLVRWTTDVFEPFDLDLFATAQQFGLEQSLLSFYGITDAPALESEPIVAYRADVDMLALATADDPPIWVENQWENVTYPLSVGALFHHPFHARVLVDAADAAGIETVAYMPKLEIADPSGETSLDFTLRLLE